MADLVQIFFKHPTAEVLSRNIGHGTKIWQFVVVLEQAVIGSNCNINYGCFIENNVKLGNNVTVKSGIYIWDGVECEDDVFLGPNVVFTNDIRPRSKDYKEPIHTLIKRGASIGANTTILAGVTIGAFSMTGIGSVVVNNIPDHALFFGNPARFQAWIDSKGNRLVKKSEKLYESVLENELYEIDDNGVLMRLK